MQTLREIRDILAAAGLSPIKRFGQNFLVDKNLMGKLLALAEPFDGETILEVGPGTGSLTEELLERTERVVAAEIDRALAALLQERLGDRPGLTLLVGDVLAGKHRIWPEVLAALGPRCRMVANLPYNIATPLVAQCLQSSWHSAAGRGDACLFDRLTFTVQQEVGDRLSAAVGSSAYGPVSVLVALLGTVQVGPAVPASAFWPRPKVVSRMLRIDFDVEAAARLRSVDALTAATRLAFGQRRKQIGSIFRRPGPGRRADILTGGLAVAGIDPTLRAEQVPPARFLALANALADSGMDS